MITAGIAWPCAADDPFKFLSMSFDGEGYKLKGFGKKLNLKTILILWFARVHN